ncbi:hypothetical protein ACFP1I_32390 [Dyadobacter subterraneus]|uniref:Uncharacterized protein n=1 Tax=Dyadobacter subterraneus TaxID=2773304 RepID=A0ABR9WE03_9BACT|nr:hypothetical protein [Dyadobacter subterraneus]MBE9463721.1 hypothetical protein [Dyadobacter subterraneus]
MRFRKAVIKNGYIDFNTSCNWECRKEEANTIVMVGANLTNGFTFGS